MTELTLLVPLRGRVAFTRRWLTYAVQRRFPFRVVLADGSSDGDAAAHEQMLYTAKRAGLDARYVRYPFDDGLPRFYAKLADSLSRVDTPFVALMDNDDFPIVDGLEKCASFLRSNPGWSACGGLLAGMTLEGTTDGLQGRTARFEPRCAFGNVAAPNAADRVRSQFERYQVTWYDPAHKNAIASVFAEVARVSLKDVFLAELLASHLLAAHGPIRKLDDLMLVRQYEAPGSTAASNASATAVERMRVPTWEQDFAAFQDSLAAALTRDGAPLEQARNIARDGYLRYVKKGASRRRPSAGPNTRLRRLARAAAEAAGLMGPISRVKNARWAGDRGARALAGISEFVRRPPSLEVSR